MGASKHIKMALIDKNKTIKELNEMRGGEQPLQSLYNQINRDSWRFADVEKLADLLGCDVVLVDRQTGKLY